ncbi:hypothetical protein LV75_003695 [Actinokineospora diospyrosa]|uniref:Pentapeptide repeat protein n=1 Tax=Actinokineospora diospyrosa TaxID=103728 RepID=A0ABT1IEW2_9PSEU|nr:hypothetical protein [Actinokineospora diospyrosa]
MVGGAGQGIWASAFGSGGRPRRLAATSATRDRTPRRLAATSGPIRDNATSSMGRSCFARGPYDTRGRTAKQGPKSMALPRTTLRLPSPPTHTKQVRPIEQLAPASPTVQVLGWQGRRERAGMAPAVPTVQALGRWAGAGLTGGGLAPAGPTVQALGRWAGAGLTEGKLAPLGPSVQGLSRWAEADLTGGGLAPLGPSVQGLGRWVGADLMGGWVGAGGFEVSGCLSIPTVTIGGVDCSDRGICRPNVRLL